MVLYKLLIFRLYLYTYNLFCVEKFLILLRHDHTHPRTTPTVTKVMTTVKVPRPPASPANLVVTFPVTSGPVLLFICSCSLVTVAIHCVMVFTTVDVVVSLITHSNIHL